MIALLLHGDLNGDEAFGWQGFAFVGLIALAMGITFNELAKGALKKRGEKRERHAKPTRKSRQA